LILRVILFHSPIRWYFAFRYDSYFYWLFSFRFSFSPMILPPCHVSSSSSFSIFAISLDTFFRYWCFSFIELSCFLFDYAFRLFSLFSFFYFFFSSAPSLILMISFRHFFHDAAISLSMLSFLSHAITPWLRFRCRDFFIIIFIRCVISFRVSSILMIIIFAIISMISPFRHLIFLFFSLSHFFSFLFFLSSFIINHYIFRIFGFHYISSFSLFRLFRANIFYWTI